MREGVVGKTAITQDEIAAVPPVMTIDINQSNHHNATIMIVCVSGHRIGQTQMQPTARLRLERHSRAVVGAHQSLQGVPGHVALRDPGYHAYPHCPGVASCT